MAQFRLSILALPIVLLAGCATVLPVGMHPIRQPVTAISIDGYRNLDDRQVRITDPDEIEKFQQLIRKSKRGWSRALVSCNISEAQFLRISIERGDSTTDVVMRNGLVLDDSDDHGSFYSPENQSQSELWHLALAHLGVEEAE